MLRKIGEERRPLLDKRSEKLFEPGPFSFQVRSTAGLGRWRLTMTDALPVFFEALLVVAGGLEPERDTAFLLSTMGKFFDFGG